MGWIWWIGILAVAGADSGALEEDFTLRDLEKIQGKGRWAEVVLRAKQVPAADRGKTWERVVARSAERYLTQLHGEGSLDGLEMAVALPAQFPFLFANPAFLKVRHEVAVEGLARCYQNPFAEEICADRAVELVTKEKSNDKFWGQVLETLSKAKQPAGTVAVVKVLLNASTAPNLCSRADFKTGLRGLWESGDFEKQFEATQLVRSHCFGVLKGWLREVSGEKGPAASEACKIFKRKAERVPACESSKGKKES